MEPTVEIKNQSFCCLGSTFAGGFLPRNETEFCAACDVLVREGSGDYCATSDRQCKDCGGSWCNDGRFGGVPTLNPTVSKAPTFKPTIEKERIPQCCFLWSNDDDKCGTCIDYGGKYDPFCNRAPRNCERGCLGAFCPLATPEPTVTPVPSQTFAPSLNSTPAFEVDDSMEPGFRNPFLDDDPDPGVNLTDAPTPRPVVPVPQPTASPIQPIGLQRDSASGLSFFTSVFLTLLTSVALLAS